MKYTFIIILSLFIFSFSQAQDYYGSSYSGKKVSLGITLSPNIHWLRYDNSENVETSTKLGYNYGLLADFAMSENYFFSTGFLINSLNAGSKFSEGSFTTYKLQYIEVPFGLKLQSTQRYYRSYYGQFGFSAGMKISGDRERSGEDKASLGSGADIFRLALQVGGGVNWQLDHKLNMMTGLTFNNGFTSVLKEGNPRSSYLAFNLGIFF